MIKNLLAVFALAVCIVALPGCKTAGKGLDEIGYMTGLADRPEKFNSRQSVYNKARGWEGLWDVKPKAKDKIGDTLSLLQAHSDPDDLDTNMFLVLHSLDTDRDGTISADEADSGSKDISDEVAGILGRFRIKKDSDKPTTIGAGSSGAAASTK